MKFSLVIPSSRRGDMNVKVDEMSHLWCSLGGLHARNTWMDALKGVGILFVIAVHCGGEGLPRNIGRLVGSGAAWVQLFLILTVVLTFSSLSRTFDAGVCKPSVCPWRWWVRRFFRLVPLYYVALVLSTWLTGGCACWLGSEEHITGLNLLAHLLMLHGLFPHYVDSIIGVEWYLGVISIFIVLAPLAFRYVNTVPRALATFTAGVVFEHYLVSVGPDVFCGLVNDPDVVAPYLSYFCFPASVPTLALGIIVWNVLRRKPSEWPEHEVWAVSFGFLFLIMYHGQLRGANALYYLSSETTFAIWFSLLIVVMHLKPLKCIDNIVFQFLGRHSYGLYLFHMIFLMSTSECGFPWLVKYFGCLLASLALTLMFEALVERPIVSWGARFLGGGAKD